MQPTNSYIQQIISFVEPTPLTEKVKDRTGPQFDCPMLNTFSSVSNDSSFQQLKKELMESTVIPKLVPVDPSNFLSPEEHLLRLQIEPQSFTLVQDLEERKQAGFRGRLFEVRSSNPRQSIQSIMINLKTGVREGYSSYTMIINAHWLTATKIDLLIKNLLKLDAEECLFEGFDLCIQTEKPERFFEVIQLVFQPHSFEASVNKKFREILIETIGSIKLQPYKEKFHEILNSPQKFLLAPK